MEQTDYQNITYSVSERIATIVLNRPERRNALDYRLRRELVHALRRAESDDGVTVVLVEAAGSSFCSGYDLAMVP